VKVIFLDIDGVLTTSRYKAPTGSKQSFDPVSVAMLNGIVEKTGAKIVISSDWRKVYTLNQIRSIFKQNGVVDAIVGATPTFPERTVMRGLEIQEYMDKSMNNSKPVEEFIILDDEEDMLHLANYYIEIDFRVGITAEDANRAIRMLS
jgi:spore maturation protein CgeB